MTKHTLAKINDVSRITGRSVNKSEGRVTGERACNGGGRAEHARLLNPGPN